MITDDIKTQLNAAAVEVFGTMYFTPIELLPELPNPANWRLESSYIKTAITFQGHCQAELVFYFPRTLGISIASGFLGLDPEAVTDQQLTDTMQESVNMIVGNLLGRIDPAGECALGIPLSAVVQRFSPETGRAGNDELLAFITDFGYLWLVISAR